MTVSEQDGMIIVSLLQELLHEPAPPGKRHCLVFLAIPPQFLPFHINLRRTCDSDLGTVLKAVVI